VPETGQDLKKEIDSFVIRENIEAGWIVTAVGSLEKKPVRPEIPGVIS